MVFRLDTVVPWGRNFTEYSAMFALDERDLSGRILGCADGPASFNAELTRRGGRVVSADPLYDFRAEEIQRRIKTTSAEVLAQTCENQDQFVWNTIASVEDLGRIRRSAMERFLSDYADGRREGRYIPAALPALPFADGAFDIALCSHFLFLYSDSLDADFHCRAIAELCRVADEARIFPLLDLTAKTSPYLAETMEVLKRGGFECSVERVDYEFQKGGNRMMRIRAPG